MLLSTLIIKGGIIFFIFLKNCQSTQKYSLNNWLKQGLFISPAQRCLLSSTQKTTKTKGQWCWTSHAVKGDTQIHRATHSTGDELWTCSFITVWMPGVQTWDGNPESLFKINWQKIKIKLHHKLHKIATSQERKS